MSEIFDRYDDSLSEPRDPDDDPSLDLDPIAALVGHDVLVQRWEDDGTWTFIYRGILDEAEGLPDGLYQGTGHRFNGGVLVRGGRVVGVSS